MTPARVDGQRDVVKNERRQSYENRPYGMASLALDEMLWPAGHPYSWPTIGHMEDLTAASYDDVVEFFSTYYAPNNASLVVAGDIDLARAQALVEKWFSEIPRGAEVMPVAPPAARLVGVERRTLTDRVRLPRLYLAWLTPRRFAPGDAALDVLAAVLADGKNSRLYKRLVYDTQMAQDVTAYQDSGCARQLVPHRRDGTAGPTAAELTRAIDEEIARLQARAARPRARSSARSIRSRRRSTAAWSASAGSAARPISSTSISPHGGGPDFFAEDLARYTALDAADVQAAAREWLPVERRVELVVEPEVAP